jgi:hypothetical protein
MIPRGDAHCAASMSAAQCSLEVAQKCLIARVPNGAAECNGAPPGRVYRREVVAAGLGDGLCNTARLPGKRRGLHELRSAKTCDGSL